MPDPIPLATAAPIPVARPRLPPADAILPYLRQIDANQWYSNHGPLANQFQARLAEHWGLAQSEVALLASGTSALTLALLASGARPQTRCLMPSWTFSASAGAVVQAGLRPHFVDVLPGSWAPDPDTVRRLAGQHDVSAILVVAPFGAPLDLAAWDGVQRATGVPVIVDAAAAFDTLRATGPMALGSCPVVVSLHATKVFGVGEGGAVLSRDPAWMERVRRLAQFGFLGTRQSVLPGVNAKLSEYAAAVGLAGMDCWAETRARWERATRRYMDRLPQQVATAPGFGADWVSSTLNVLWPADRLAMAEQLSDAGIQTLNWWGAGCHAQPAYRNCPAEPLPVTQALARRTVGLPFWQDLADAQIDVVCRVVARHCEARPASRQQLQLAAA